MTHEDGIAIVKRYRDLLIKEGIPVQSIFLFGSVARGDATDESDIDVAVVCEPFAPERMEEVLALWRARREIDIRIEPVCFHPRDFEEKLSFAREIERTGIEV